MVKNLYEAYEHDQWNDLGNLALGQSEEATKNGNHSVAKKLKDAAVDMFNRASKAKAKLKRDAALLEDIGYENLDNKGKLNFHTAAMKRWEIIFNRSKTKEARDEANAEHRHHFQKAGIFKRLLDSGVKDF